ncbi:MAG: DUF6438 domain-containing protein [Alphaproteobacteria bacterium]|nr:DUF6438 domain-containing protein [Alphaproteobacteria bacterium]
MNMSLWFWRALATTLLVLAAALFATAISPAWDNSLRRTIAGIFPMLESRPALKTPFPSVKDWNSVRIKLARTMCFGSCPVYEVEIHGDGTIVYEGRAFVALMGRHRARIPKAAVAQLVDQLHRAEFFWLHDAYRSNITDNPANILTVTFDDRSKTVVDYVGEAVGMPDAVTNLETAIDRAADTERWRKGNANTAPSLTAENWNFKSSSDENRALAAGLTAYADAETLRSVIALGAPLTLNADLRQTRSEYDAPATALDVAALRDDPEILKAILDAHAPWTKQQFGEALLRAAARGRPAIVMPLIAAGADPTYRRPNLPRKKDPTGFEGPGSAGRSVLMGAAIAGVPALVETILNAKPDVNAREEYGWTALHFAANPSGKPYPEPKGVDRVRVIEMLIAAGANPNARNDVGKTPLMTVVFNPPISNALLNAGAKPAPGAP